MLGRPSRPRGRDEEGGATQPLLNDSDEDLPSSSAPSSHSPRPNGDVLFSVDDDSDGDDGEEELLGHEDINPHAHGAEGKPVHTVRFQEDVQVIAPPLRSTFQSRETGK